MVRYYQAYKGSTQTPLIYKEGKLVKKIYRGSALVYQIGFETFTVEAGTSLLAWTVPLGVTKIHIDCVASRGYGNSGKGGNGGRVECDLNVSSGQVLYITAGGIPENGYTASYNASDIRIDGSEYSNRIIIAGGGGSGATAKGGAGGGLTGANAVGVGYQAGAFGGTQEAGGGASYRSGGNTDGWLSGSDGSLGIGGNGGSGYMYGGFVWAGSGGAGYYGGGGGGVYDINKVGITYAGGGGGSSYTGENCSNITHTQGYRDGAGYVTISFVE